MIRLPQFLILQAFCCQGDLSSSHSKGLQLVNPSICFSRDTKAWHALLSVQLLKKELAVGLVMIPELFHGDRGKIVNYLLLISVYLFCIFLVYFSSFMFILVLQDNFGRKWKKGAKTGQKQSKLVFFYEEDKNLADRSTRLVNHFGQRPGVAVPAFGKLNQNFLF